MSVNGHILVNMHKLTKGISIATNPGAVSDIIKAGSQLLDVKKMFPFTDKQRMSKMVRKLCTAVCTIR